MNLICFPHYTCGGLLCDILNNTYSTVSKNGGINSIHHSLGKIGDADTVFNDYDPEYFVKQLEKINQDSSQWIGTHCWPGALDLGMLDQVIVVTTTTFRSKLYRWIRAYYHYYSESDPWTVLQAQERVDKERETAKNYIMPFGPVFRANVTNIEFCEVVENSVEFLKLMSDRDIVPHLDRWKKINSFLYDADIWNSAPVKRFYEAELESSLKKSYVYQ